MTDRDWLEQIKAGTDAGWEPVWRDVVVPEARSLRSADLMRRYSLTEGDLMGMLYNEMIGRGKIDLFRGEGSLQGWLRKYVHGFVLAADPAKHGEISLESARSDAGDGPSEIEIPVPAGKGIAHDEVWLMTHVCFHDLWNEDPERAYVHILRTRFRFSSEEVRDFLGISSVDNVNQIFSRNVKFMRKAWLKHEAKWD